MTAFVMEYATPGAIRSSRDRATLGLTLSARRPVRFHRGSSRRRPSGSGWPCKRWGSSSGRRTCG